MNEQDKEKEILEAACLGINEFLRTTRGSNIFGASAKASLTDDGIHVVGSEFECVLCPST